ncbi:allantoinase AllB [Maridesulfovibrio bastinii]|uniref:allantoinase AllB n=1 Tax=Maridesulfovibrio bastinii TaxID=47157 RepID=UPI00042A4B49|nr:allantoinase AllB [Maridesulfovibrio bastinii]
MFDLVLQNARLVTEDAVRDADIGITDGKISGIECFDSGSGCDSGSGLKGSRTIDCSGKMVFPGFIDLHVHFNDPGLTRREDYFTGSSGAAAGGITLFADMPLSNAPYTLTNDNLLDKIDRASKKSLVDFALWGGFVEDNTAQLKPMSESGAYGFKMFTCGAGDGFPTPESGTMERGFKISRELGTFVGVHCEDQEIMDRNAQNCPADMDEIDRFLTVHDAESELAAVRKAIALAGKTGAHLHICHASLPETVDLATEARKKGLAVTVETCPQYLICTGDDLRRIGGPLKCTPPVRDRKSVEGMWERIFAGDIDFVGTDHSPAETAEKIGKSFDSCWGGVNGIQYLFSLLHTEGVVKRNLDIRRLVGLYSAGPAKFIGHYPEKGTLEVGSEASFVIFDPEAEWTVRAEDQLTKHCQTPYDGMRCKGRIEQTWLRGKTVCEYDFASGKYRIEASAGSGKFVTPVNNKGKK